MSIVNAAGQMMRRGAPAAAAGVMYLGGGFNGANSVRASTRNRAAAVDADVTANTDAMVEAWDPDCTGPVFAMSLNGSDMYLGGSFLQVRGTARLRAACVDSDVTQANPTLRAWDPNCGSIVRQMVLNGSDMYLGGDFTTVRATARNCAACVDSDVTQANPTLRAWNPNCNGFVGKQAMILNGSDMYLGGNFTTVRGTSRNHAACVDSDSSQANPALRAWDPNCDGEVTSFVLNGSDMYMAGRFGTVRGTARLRAAAVDSDVTQAAPTLRAWDPSSNGIIVFTMLLHGSDMYVGGNFTEIGGEVRNRLAAVDSDVTQAAPTVRDWDPDLGNSPYRLICNGDHLYVVGVFQTVGGVARLRAACIEADTSVAAPTLFDWDPTASSTIEVMVLA